MQGFAARVAGSLLNAIGLPELVTTTEQDYEELILELATNPTKLAQVKDKLATNRLTQPLFNTELYTKHLENGYHQAYQNYFDGNPPQDNHCTKVKRKTTHRTSSSRRITQAAPPPASTPRGLKQKYCPI